MKFKNILITILITLSAFLSISSIHAMDSLTKYFDTSLVAGIEYQYVEQDKILITQIQGQYDTLNMSTEDFLNTFYYYSITKLKLGNIPIHYAIDENGDLFKTQNYNSIRITDTPYIVIGYLSNNPELSTKAKAALLDISNELSHTYGISTYDVKNYAITVDDNDVSSLSFVEPTKLFKNSVDSVLNDWKISEREHQEYKVEISNIEYSETVEIGKQLEIKVTLKNIGEDVWFSNKNPIYISVKDSNESIYAVNGEWDSFSKPISIASDRYVLPGETIELSFKLDPKVLPGEASETFEVLKFEGEPFTDSEFEVKFTVEKGDNTLVKISSPEYGFVNIRECTTYNCDKIGVANDGEVYIVNKQDGAWYEIIFGEDLTGWVYGKYIRKL